MANYQLYRSNVYLGGQMKYDIVLGKDGNKLIVKDFHITPISSKSPNNKYAKDYLLNYKHHENIAKFYKKNSGSFYNDFANPSLTNPWPLKKSDNNDKPESNSDSTYEMGCRRMQYYQLYNKQFEFFCPIWLENLKKDEYLRFKINVYNDEGMSYLIDSINIDLESRGKNDFHDKFCEYFYEYLRYIKCINEENNINNWLFDINKNHSSVHGVDVTTGELKYLKCNSLFTNLTSRVRPVLETNNMILTELKNKLLIVKQLINFNLCFDVSDIFTNSIGLEMNGGKVYINIKTYICNNDKEAELDLVDFFTNHEYIAVDDCNIPKLNINNLDNPLANNIDDTKEQKNVLNYLGDFKYIDLITKNKIIQNTFHWCLTDNPTYHFNFYDGFAGTYNGKKLSVQNQTTPDVSYPEYNKNINQYWCNIWKVEDAIGIFAKLFSNISSYKYLFSTWDNNCYVKNIFYEKNKKIDHPINIAFFIVDDFFNIKSNNKGFWKSFSKLEDDDIKEYNIQIETLQEPEYDEDGNIIPQELEYNDEEIFTALRLRINKEENNENYYIFLIHTDTIKYNFPFKKFIEQIKSDNNDDEIKQILNGMKIKSDILTIPGGITPDKYPGPSLSSEEIRYYKNNELTILDRQLGKINPYFIKKNDPKYFNYRYFKYNINNLEEKNEKGYKKYSNTNFLPLYPSLNYWCFGKNKEGYKNISDEFEWNYFDYNKIILLTPIISTMFTIKNNEKTIEELVKKYLKDKYPYHINLSKTEKEWYDWVYNKYQYKSTFNSSEDDNYKYNVEIKLK
jgi:hypothetical protein